MSGVGALPFESLQAWLTAVGDHSYYDILELHGRATSADIKKAFHDFAVACHPDQYVDRDPASLAAAGEVFKRGVEAYQVLSRPATRAKYDANLAKGKLRYVEGEQEQKKAPAMRTLEQIAKTPRAKQFAVKADRLISVGRLDEARVALVTALQDDYDNDELKDRLAVLYEAMALEPL